MSLPHQQFEVLTPALYSEYIFQISLTYDFEQRRHALHASRSMYKYKLQMCNLLPSGIKCKQQKDQEKMLPSPFPKKGKGIFLLSNLFPLYDK